MTTSWVINGYGVTDLQEDIAAAIDAERDRVRDRVREGTEDAPVLDIPVVQGSTPGHTRRIVREYASRKGYDGADVDVMHAYLGNKDRPPAPRDVVDVMSSLSRKDGHRDKLVAQSLAAGLAALPPTRLLPELPPAATKMLQYLLAERESVTAEQLVAVTPETSYERHRRKLLATDLVEEAGPGEFVAYVEPWWATDADEPREDTHESVFSTSAYGAAASSWREAIAHLFYHGPGVYESTNRDGTQLFERPIDVAEVRAELPEWAWFLDFVIRLLDGPPDGDDATHVVLGTPPPGMQSDQTALPAGRS